MFSSNQQQQMLNSNQQLIMFNPNQQQLVFNPNQQQLMLNPNQQQPMFFPTQPMTGFYSSQQAVQRSPDQLNFQQQVITASSSGATGKGPYVGSQTGLTTDTTTAKRQKTKLDDEEAFAHVYDYDDEYRY